jgi:Domain of unknown function (DUF4398)
MSPLSRFQPLALVMAVLLLLGAVAGCAGAPVQEMSNARQAVQAAERAGAAVHAPADLSEAKRLLKQAESNIRLGNYRAARDAAEKSREKAMVARHVAETRAAAANPP